MLCHVSDHVIEADITSRCRAFLKQMTQATEQAFGYCDNPYGDEVD
jgi:hypothetical protein